MTSSLKEDKNGEAIPSGPARYNPNFPTHTSSKFSIGTS
jgi:hypothetical protein